MLACTLSRVEPDEEDLHMIFNMSPESLRLYLPKLATRNWHLSVDTAADSPGDIIEPGDQKPVEKRTIPVAPSSVVVLESREQPCVP